MSSLKCVLFTAVSISASMASFSVRLPSMLNVKTAEKTVSPDAVKLINQKVICHSKIYQHKYSYDSTTQNYTVFTKMFYLVYKSLVLTKRK